MAEPFAVICAAEMVNEAEIAPAGTFTGDGIETLLLLTVRATVAPPAGAVVFSVTVHESAADWVNVLDAHASEDTAGSETGETDRSWTVNALIVSSQAKNPPP